jgi:SAM-dependent methyltransferase
MIETQTRTNGATAYADLIDNNAGIRLDIGCGANKQPGFVGMDIRDVEGVDIVHDVESYPWPLPDECVLMAMASHLVEHINPAQFGFINFMNEVWRIMKPGGEFAVSCPHGRSSGYLQDPTHCNMLNEATWAYFAPEHSSGLWGIYKPQPWRVKHLSWRPWANMEVVLVKLSGVVE